MKRPIPGMLMAAMMLALFSITITVVADDDNAQVTLHIFSGRPDPVWSLGTLQTYAFRDILDTLPPGEESEIPSILGYRGFEVHLGEEIVHVFDGHVHLTTGSRWLEDRDHALELWLLGTAGEALEPDLVAMLWTQFATADQPAPGASSATEGFAIYLVTGDLTPADAAHAELTSLPRQADPVIRMEDITVYHAADHTFELTPEGRSKLETLHMPVSGLPFVACVDGDPIYAGAFWDSYSSLMYYESVVLNVHPIDSDGLLRLDLGYPASPDLYAGVDLRADPRILAAFEAAGKLD